MTGYLSERGMSEAVGVWCAAGLLALVLFYAVSKYLFVFGLGVAVGLIAAYEIAVRWIGCIL